MLGRVLRSLHAVLRVTRYLGEYRRRHGFCHRPERRVLAATEIVLERLLALTRPRRSLRKQLFQLRDHDRIDDLRARGPDLGNRPVEYFVHFAKVIGLRFRVDAHGLAQNAEPRAFESVLVEKTFEARWRVTYSVGGLGIFRIVAGDHIEDRSRIDRKSVV